MKETTTKTTIASILAAVIIGGGTYSIKEAEVQVLKETNDTQVQMLADKNVELLHEKFGKQDILKRYIYSQISSCKTITPDLTYTGLDEIAAQTYNLVKENGIDPTTVDLTASLKQIAVDNGDSTCK